MFWWFCWWQRKCKQGEKRPKRHEGLGVVCRIWVACRICRRGNGVIIGSCSCGNYPCGVVCKRGNGVVLGSCSHGNYPCGGVEVGGEGNYSGGGVEVGSEKVEELLGGWVRTSGLERGLFVSRVGVDMGIGIRWFCRR